MRLRERTTAVDYDLLTDLPTGYCIVIMLLLI